MRKEKITIRKNCVRRLTRQARLPNEHLLQHVHVRLEEDSMVIYKNEIIVGVKMFLHC